MNFVKHGRHEQVVGLVDLSEVHKRQECNVFENAVFFAEVTFFEKSKHLLNQMVDHGKNFEQFRHF